jgi:molybdopterin/thiamine biosynthesis adenylyltransferase/rhodanese-related sulfurtransferase
LAAPALPLLAGAGIGHLMLIDGDYVDVSNLHRQTLFTDQECGQPKSEVAAERCRQINPDIHVENSIQSLTPENATEFVKKADVVLDCADSYAASYTLSDTCLALGVPLISASVLGLEGYVGGFCHKAPSLRAVFPEAPDSGVTCATAGVLGPVVGIVGAIQAQMALAVLLDLEPSPMGRMVRLDARQLSCTSFRFNDVPEPEQSFRFLAQSQLTDDDLIIELRGEEEAPVAIHPSALRILPESLPDNLPNEIINEDRRIALCCATGLRSWRTAERIKDRWSGEIVLVADKAS